MKVQILIMFLFFGITNIAKGQQKVMTKTGQASFFSKAPMEDIEAHNQNVVAILDLNKQEVAVKLLIKQFNFENSLMQEHFNENYMESDKFPSATFTGSIVDGPEILLVQAGEYEVNIAGELEIHGVKNPLETKATLIVHDGKISVKTNFQVTTADYKIKIPKLVIKNIAETIDIKLTFELEQI